MPTYDYQCEACDNIVERIRTISKRNDPLDCEKCGGSMVKLIGKSGGFLFKGTGFYCTDYNKENVVGCDND